MRAWVAADALTAENGASASASASSVANAHQFTNEECLSVSEADVVFCFLFFLQLLLFLAVHQRTYLFSTCESRT